MDRKGAGRGEGEQASSPRPRLTPSVPPSPPPLPPPAARLFRALEQLRDDPGRVDLTEPWRHFAGLVDGQPAGGPVGKADKLRAALAAHLPRDRPAEVGAFLARLDALVAAYWGMALPPPGGMDAQHAQQAAAAAAMPPPEVAAVSSPMAFLEGMLQPPPRMAGIEVAAPPMYGDPAAAAGAPPEEPHVG